MFADSRLGNALICGSLISYEASWKQVCNLKQIIGFDAGKVHTCVDTCTE